MTQTTPPPRPARAFLTWLWAALLILGGVGFLGATTGLLPLPASPLPVLAGALGLLAIPFVIRWLTHRTEWVMALAAWVFFALGVLVALIWLDPAAPQLILTLMLAEIALPFAAVALANRSRWWALIPLYALLALGGLAALTILHLPRTTLGAFGLLMAALPFWVVYMMQRSRWWPLIPAGGLTAAGVLVLALATLFRPGAGAFYVVLNLVLAGVFAALWLTMRRFEWSLVLAIGFVLAAALSVWVPSAANWALVALALGLYIAYRQIAGTRAPKQAAKPTGQPPAAAPASQPTAQTAQPAQAQASAPAPTPAPPAAGASPAAAPSAGARADQEATDSAQRRAGQAGQPVVEFRPLDPFKARREQAAKDEDEG